MTSPSHGAPRPKLLFLCQTLPFPPDGGVKIRTFNVLKLLARAFDVTALCFFRKAMAPDGDTLAASVHGLSDLASVEVFPIPQEHSRTRMAWDHLRSLRHNRVYTCYAYQSAPFLARLQEILEVETFNVVHLDSLDLSFYLPFVRQIPTVCVHHNVESELLLRRVATEKSLPRRAYLKHQGRLMAAEEERWCPRVSLNVAVSEHDRSSFLERIPSAPFAVVPNGVDVETFHPGQGTEKEIVFVGGTTWFPNRDALHFFSEEVLPRIRALGIQAPVRWVGRASEAEQARYATADFQVTGYVDDIRPIVQKAACYIVPLRIGGGTRLKILDAWAMGKAVVSTSVGCEGLKADDGENILIADSPAEFATAVSRVLSDDQLRSRLERNARATAERHYSWTSIGSRMLAEYAALLQDGDGSFASAQARLG